MHAGILGVVSRGQLVTWWPPGGRTVHIALYNCTLSRCCCSESRDAYCVLARLIQSLHLQGRNKGTNKVTATEGIRAGYILHSEELRPGQTLMEEGQVIIMKANNGRLHYL